MTVIAVGSTNSAKVEATRSAFGRWLGDVRVLAFDVDSDVPVQPMGDEVFAGASARARAAQSCALVEGIEPEYSVGIEAGIVQMGAAWCSWGAVCIVDKRGMSSTGTTPAFELPREIVDCLTSGGELGKVMEEVSRDTAIRQHRGAVGLFTKGLLTRQDLFESGILAALAPHVSPEWYRT